jgi:hypothetical protein
MVNGGTMYLKKQIKQNIEGSIAWLEQELESGAVVKLDPKVTLNFLKHILVNDE